MAGAFSFSGMSVTRHSVVRIMFAMLAAFCRAVLTTFAGTASAAAPSLSASVQAVSQPGNGSILESGPDCSIFNPGEIKPGYCYKWEW